MDAISQQAFFQALGWATLNSFWQAGLLWCVFVLLRRWGVLHSSRQFIFSVCAILLSFLCFIVSLWLYLAVQEPIPFFTHLFGQETKAWLPMMLLSASVSYLIVLIFPVIKLVQNLAFLRRLRQTGLVKADVHHRLFVSQTGSRMGIKKSVSVSFSSLIYTPLTIGFFKPIILLPIASFNQLTLRQAEAVLLHELAHIRRHDFLINLFICIIHTLLYFNPFVRLFVHAVENSREDCCDGMVLQFGYDSFAYASALLQLEKARQPFPNLVMNATGKRQLLSRIENIVGMPRSKPSLRLHHFGGLLASVLCVMALHSLIFQPKKPGGDGKFLMEIANPFAFAYDIKGSASKKVSKPSIPTSHEKNGSTAVDAPLLPVDLPTFLAQPFLPEAPMAIQVAKVDNALAQLATEDQQVVQEMVKNTKKTLEKFEWKVLEKNIADAFTEEEKAIVQNEYMAQVDMIDWNNLALNMAANYQQTDWQRLQAYIQMAESSFKQDSLAADYNKALCEVQALHDELGAAAAIQERSHQDLKKLQIQLKQKRDSLVGIKQRPVIKL